MVRISTLLPVFAAMATSQATRLLGRVNPATKELTWSATGISFAFTGTSASVPITSLWGSNSIQMVIDDGAPIVTDNVTGSSIETPTLAKGKHKVEIRKKSEALYGSVTFGDVKVTGGKLEKDKVPKRRMQIIGDSITAGYGLDGVAPCAPSAALENAPKTYAGLTAKNLSADYDIVAWSGVGLLRNYASAGEPDTQPKMPERWTRWGANDADNSYTFPASDTPDIVVVNLGTNDFSYLGVREPMQESTFADAMFAFGSTLRRHYPKAEFFFTSSPMLGDTWPTVEDAQHTTHANAVKSAVKRLGRRTHFVEFPTQGAEVGCDSHPTGATHASMAVILTAAIEDVLH